MEKIGSKKQAFGRSSNNCSSSCPDEDVQCHRRFEEACEMIQKNASKFIDQEWPESSSSDDDEDVNFSVVQKTWSHYNGPLTTDNEQENLLIVKDYLQDIITHGAITCLICIESVSKKEKIWNCQNCYCVLHLSCIMKWAKDSLYSSNNHEHLKWSCPKCRFDYLPSDQPLKYFCFCKKVENPSFDTWGVPHSCGKICEKRLKPDCGHFCSLLCHPGPCPPCPKTVSTSCCCLKSKAVLKRCSNKGWICGKKCEKMLLCNVHYCQELCHKDSCPPCKLQKNQNCLCGAKSQLRPCTDAIWKCNKVCNEPLKCGNHFCSLICHSGPCPPCPNSGERHCPCGVKKVMLPCTENVSPCGDTCNKLLVCAIHQCSQRCHFGPCEECIQMQFKKCRCGLREKSLPCSKEYLCDTKCKRRRDCGRHNCNRKCCSGNCPPCEVPCGKTLKCGKHKCSSLCHTGPCYPCKEKMDVFCNCGLSKIVVPCGKKKSTPQCLSECKLSPDCHHPKRHKHKCHYGKCPPCRLTCGKVLVCGHTCPAKCHSAVITKVDTKEKMEGPWDLRNAFKFELVSKPCPPCLIPVQVECLGGHEKTMIPCHIAKSVSCGKPCGRALSCGNHSCKLGCHEVKDRTNFEEGDSCESCSEVCQKPRKAECIHPCLLPCHPGQCSLCKQRIKMKCHCQMTVLYVLCDEWSSINEYERISRLSCLNRCPKQMSCGHRCILSCHAGECSGRESCKKKVTIRCPCKRFKKDVFCLSLIDSDPTLKCRPDCLEYQNSIKELEMKKSYEIEAEKKRQQDRELTEFLKKTDGKKKRKKKQIEILENHKRYSFLQLGALAFVVFVGVVIYFYKIF